MGGGLERLAQAGEARQLQTVIRQPGDVDDGGGQFCGVAPGGDRATQPGDQAARAVSLGRFVDERRQHVRGATGEGGEYGIAEPLVAAVPPGQAGQGGQGSGVAALAQRKGELQTDNRRVVVGELQRGGEQFFAFAKPAIGQAQRMPPHARFAVAKRGGERVVVESP